MAQASSSAQRPLRVAVLWNGSLHADELLATPRPLILGGPRGLFPLPAGLVPDDQLTLLTPDGLGYALVPNACLGGFVWLSGERCSVHELAAPTRLGPGDYGVVTLGSLAVFFQEARPVEQPLPARLSREPALLASLGLSVFVHVAALLFLFLIAAKELAPQAALELDTELVRRFLVVPPPEDEPLLRKARSAAQTQAPGVHERAAHGSKKPEHAEGRIGRKQATQADTQLAGEPKAALANKVRGLGLLGVLSGGGPSHALSHALDTPTLDKMLGGLGSVQTQTGRGSGGLGLHGGGAAGGGSGKSGLLGAGELATGVAAGGGGKGKPSGGLGVTAPKAREAQLSLDDGSAHINGFLSKEQIDRVVRANQAAIKYCFEVEMQHDPKLAGAVSMNWRIDLSGHVTVVRVAKSTLGNAHVEGCMVRQIKRWAFPKPDGGEVEVTYPFLLRGS